MTVVLAYVGIDCVALAADGLAAGGDRDTTRTVVKKLGDLHGRIGYGFAGCAGLRQRAIRSLESAVTPEECGRDIVYLQPRLHAAVNDVQHEGMKEQVTTALGMPVGPPNVIQALFAGVDDDGRPWVYEVTEDGRGEEHYIGEAIGSGRIYAMCALRATGHHELQKQKEEEAALLAYRVINDAIGMAARDIDFPISVYIVNREGANPIPDEALENLQHRMRSWQQEEREVFKALAEKRGLPVSKPPDGQDGLGIDLP